MSTSYDTAKPAPTWLTAFVVSGLFVGALYAIEVLDVLLDNRLDLEGIRPRDPDGLAGILFAPLLHGGWVHLGANATPLLVLGFLILLSGVSRWLAVTAIVWIIGGFGTWLTGGPMTIHIGASGLVFGWLVYLILRGLFTRHPGQIAVGVVVLFVYGGLLWGVLPNQPGISWQGHLFGAIGGAVAARLLATPTRPLPPSYRYP